VGEAHFSKFPSREGKTEGFGAAMTRGANAKLPQSQKIFTWDSAIEHLDIVYNE